MTVIDIICGAVLIALGLIGLLRGFMRQVLALLGGLVAVIGAFFLFKYVYGFISGLGFYNDMVSSIGSGIQIDLAFLRGIAEAAGKTQGQLIMEYVFEIIIYLLLVLVLGLIFKLIKKLLTAIADLPGINLIDRILGLALGLVWGALILYGLFFVLYLLKDSVGAINDFITNTVTEDSWTYKLLIVNMENIKQYFIQLFDLIKGAVTTVTTQQ